MIARKLSVALIFLLISTAYGQQTEIKYLSGTGSDHRVDWDFYCDKGRNSGRWTTIPVPSCWEQEGFGSYNYGHDEFNTRLNEQGLYRHRFMVPETWDGHEIRLVFEGVMTDAEVKVNGQLAGPIHQGAFYEFNYDVSKLLRIGMENELEVLVKKHSDNESVSRAERKADFWVFGGIFRPVYLEAKPQTNIKRIAIDAKADGTFRADIYTSGVVRTDHHVRVAFRALDGTPLDVSHTFPVDPGVTRISHSVNGHSTWNPEQPVLYEAVVELLTSTGTVLHQHIERFGFRTVEIRESDGVYVNGTRVKLKGVNRHTFHPKYGRTSSKALSVKAVETMKDMNMNAVRMSHYPPDKHFLAVCDSLGLFVLNELAAWQTPSYDDTVGLKLLTEMIHRDVNHPSIILWANGNEGGENPTLTPHFKRLDIQQREVIYPWSDFGLINTHHYIDYNYLALDGYSRRHVFFPTEVLHGLYDGGLGAGLDDYWLRIWEHPLAAGAFLWVFQDEAVARTDRHGELDTDGNHAPDGILGPYYEKEGSYYTIKDVWSPVHFEKRYITAHFDGVFRIENRYHYTDLNRVNFVAEWVRLGDGNGIEKQAESIRITVAPGQRAELRVALPDGWQQYDVLRINAIDTAGRQINKWSWPIKRAGEVAAAALPATDIHHEIDIDETDGAIQVAYDNVVLRFSPSNGTLQDMIHDGRRTPLSDGPVILGNNHVAKDVSYHREADTVVVMAQFENNDYFRWKITANGRVGLEVAYSPESRTEIAGITFSYPEDDVRGVKWMGDGPYRVYKNRMRGTTFGQWEKERNNTVTGESGYEYPEFAGYHANVYWAKIQSRQSVGFKVYVHTDDVFLRLLTPQAPRDPARTAMGYPDGDISFLNVINAIGTKFKSAQHFGPQSMPPVFDGRKIHGGKIRINLTFVIGDTD